MSHKSKSQRQAEALLRNTLPKVERIKRFIGEHQEYLDTICFNCKYTKRRIEELSAELAILESNCAKAQSQLELAAA